MRQLLLLRHAKSSWDDRDMPDHARPLNTRGRQAADAMRTAMTGLGICPDMVLVSTARRTRETAAALEPWPETPLTDALDALYLASADTLLFTLRAVPETVRSVMVVGHNPGLHELALGLLGSAVASTDGRNLRDGYPSGALAEYTVVGPWSGLSAGSARLVRFVRPRDLVPG